MATSTRRESVASNLMMLMLVVVTLTVTIVSVFALTGVFQLANDQVAARQVAYRQALDTEIVGRLDGASRVLDRASAIIIDPTQSELNRTALASQFDAGIEYMDELFVTDIQGDVVSAYPSFQAPRTLAGTAVFESGITDVTRLHYDPGDTPQLWITRQVDGPLGKTDIVARVRTAFLQLLVDEFSSSDESRLVYIVDPSNNPVVASVHDPGLRTASLKLSPAQRGAVNGSASALTTDGVVMSGQYATISGYEGLDWRIVVLEPRSAVLRATWSALTPAVVALIATGLLSVIVATVFARRLVAPLRDLEKRAREAVAGAYVSPIRSDRSDEVGRLAEAFNEIALRLNSLHDLSQLLASSSSLDQVLDGVIEATGHIVASASIGVFLIDEQGTHLVLARSRGLLVPDDPAIPLTEDSWLVDALSYGGPASFSGVRHDMGPFWPSVGDSSHISGLVAPLVVGGDPLGVIAVVQSDEPSFNQAEMEMVRTFSAQAAVAIDNSRLFEIESTSRREAEALREVAELLSVPGDLERAFERVLVTVRQLFDAAGGAVAFLDRASLGLDPEEQGASERLLTRAWEAAWSASDGDAVIRLSPGDDPAADRYLQDSSAREAILLTVMRGTEPGAVIALWIDRQARRFTPHELELAETLGTQFALALDNAYNFAQAGVRSENLETIFRISQAVSSSLQIKVVLNRVLDVVQKIFTADAVSLMEFDDSRQLVSTAMARGQLSAEMLHFECEPGADIPGRAFTSGEPQSIGDVEDSESELAMLAAARGLHSILAVPLIARGRSLGVLTVFSADRDAFSAEDMGLLLTFASQAALAIDTAALYQREYSISRVLQASILPQRLPVYDDIESSSIYLAAGGESEIGGDYYDLFRAPDNSVVLAIGDVCGKGVAAATKTSMLKYTIRGLVAAGLGPARVIAEVNRMTSETDDATDIVTLWVGMIDTARHTLRHANGGHPPGLLFRERTGELHRLETTGALLGAIANTPYTEVSQKVESGDVILLYTDGVAEARRGNKFFGEGRIRRAMRYGGTPAQMTDRLLASVDRFAPGPLRDDAAVLVVRILDPAPGNKR